MSKLFIGEFGEVRDAEHVYAPPVYDAPTIVESHLNRGLWINDPSAPGTTDLIKDLELYSGYEGALMRIWLHPDSDQVMLSTRKIADARDASFNGSKTFGEMADLCLPKKEILFRNKKVVYFMIFVDNHLFQATKAYFCGTYAVFLFSYHQNDDKTWKLVAAREPPPQSRGLYPTETDFQEKFGRIVSRRRLSLDEANHLLKNYTGDHRHFELGEFVFAETRDHRHIRINSKSYQWRRDVVGDGGNVRQRLEKVIDQMNEVAGICPLPVTIVNFGTPVAAGTKFDLIEKSWVSMTPEERELTAMFVFANCLPDSGYKFVVRLIREKLGLGLARPSKTILKRAVEQDESRERSDRDERAQQAEQTIIELC